VKIDKGQQKIKILRTNQQSNLGGSCQSIFPSPWKSGQKIKLRFLIGPISIVLAPPQPAT